MTFSFRHMDALQEPWGAGRRASLLCPMIRTALSSTPAHAMRSSRLTILAGRASRSHLRHEHQ